MTDRELLVLAAKAAGYNLKSYHEETDEHQEMFIAYLPVPGREDEYPDYWSEEAWNPLTDDGDALRLAVKLMEFEPYKNKGYLPCILATVEETRRAIVRAAAEIGKSM